MLAWNGGQAQRRIEARAKAVGEDAAWYLHSRMLWHVPYDSGELHDSIGPPIADGFTFRVVASAAHAVPVEFGHLAGSTWVAPNPFTRRAIADTKAAFPSIARGARVSSRDAADEHYELAASFLASP